MDVDVVCEAEMTDEHFRPDAWAEYQLQEGESIEAALTRYEGQIFGRLMAIIMRGDNKDSLAAIARIYAMAPARGGRETGSFADRIRGRVAEMEAVRDLDGPDGLEDED